MVSSANDTHSACHHSDSKAGLHTATTHELLIEGAGCASCVSKIEGALRRVRGVQSASMNFAQRTVTVIADITDDQLIRAVEAAGYNAKVIGSEAESDLLKEKEEADWAYYKRLMLEMSIALSLGIPLMIYSLVIGEMTVNTNTERFAWLVVGLFTLGVMVFSGKHFYIGAWKSFVNHSANMDTLIDRKSDV